MKKLILLFSLLIGCSSSEPEINYETITIDQSKASKLIDLSIDCVDKKFPYKIGFRFDGEDWVRPHYELTPSFYGCWDWHSAVHGHWAMVKVIKDFPNIPEKEIILNKLKSNLSEKNLNKEYEFFQNDFAKGFERTYGWAWLMKLYSELLSWDNENAQEWASNLKPLVELLSERTITFLDKLSTPLRPGTHANTAFSFSLMIEYALIANDTNLYNKIKDYSIKNFSFDTNCPVSYEAALMSSILEKKEFNKWFKTFIPSLKEPEFNNIINPPVVLDPKDPGIGHLIGLMFHRAWTLKEIANKLNKKSEKTFLLQISDLHSKKGYDIMFESGYGGEHWLATFALYNFLR